MFPVEIIGYLGMISLLIAWFLVRKHEIASYLASILGSGIMTLYGFILGREGIPIILLNISWIIITIYHIRGNKKR
jgi:uncharacterized membrane protein YjjB (DUF3815 family)